VENNKDYIHSITFLRAIASLGVCAVHLHYATPLFRMPAGKIISYGMHGVSVFFVISGFVIPYSLWNSRYTTKNFFSYILKRSLRIDPPYIATIFLCLIIGAIFNTFEFNFFKFLLHLFYLIPFTDHTWYQGVFWTLGIEFQFYVIIGLLFPFLLFRNANVVVLFLLIIGATGYLLTFKNENAFIFKHIHFFCMGILVVLFKKQRISLLKLYLSLTLLAIYICLKISITTGLVGYLTSLSIIHLNFESTISDFLGKISYSLYLIHLQVGGIFIYFLKRFTLNPYMLFLVLLMGCIIFSYLFYISVERPSINFSKKVKVGK
jgi:peptidoglycan/LPS O-acetylase OafA/YrhL